MRPRFTMLAAALCGVAAVAAPAAASAAPRHNHGLTIAATPNPIVSGEGVLIYGTLKGSDSSDQTIYLYHRVAPQTTYSLIQKTTTNNFGEYEFTRAEGVVTTNRNWYVVGPDGSHSRTIHERVASIVNLTAGTADGTTRQSIPFTGSVAPTHPDQRVLLQDETGANGNTWKTIASTFTNASSTFSFGHAWAIPGVYTLRAYFPTDPRNIAGESDSVTVSIQQKENPSFTIGTSTSIVSEGQSATITGTLDSPGTTTPETNTSVTLYAKTAQGTWQAIADVLTGTGGGYTFTVTPVNNTVYQARTTFKPQRLSAVLYEGVQDTLTVTGPSTAEVGQSIMISGTVAPNKTGHAIWLQRLGADGHWHNVELGVVNAGSAYTFSYVFGQAGTFQLRARIYGGPDNVGGASSAVTVAVTGVEPVTSLPPAS